MATRHTEQAVSHYRNVETALAALGRMLEQTDLQNADGWTTKILWAVSNKLLAVEGAWAQAVFEASINRTLADADDERETMADALDVGVQ